MDRVIEHDVCFSEESAQDSLASMVEHYRERVCEFCDGTGELHDDEHDANGQLSGIGTITVPCSCQKRDNDE